MSLDTRIESWNDYMENSLSIEVVSGKHFK